MKLLLNGSAFHSVVFNSLAANPLHEQEIKDAVGLLTRAGSAFRLERDTNLEFSLYPTDALLKAIARITEQCE